MSLVFLCGMGLGTLHAVHLQRPAHVRTRDHAPFLPQIAFAQADVRD